MIKKILAAIICILMIVGALTVSATDIEEIKQRQEELKKQNEEYQAILDQQNADVAEQQEYVDALVGKVETVTLEIQLSHEKIAAIEDQIAEKEAEIEEKNLEIEDKLDVLRQRIKTIYMAGDVSSLEVILGAKDFDDFLDKLQLVKSVSAHDEKLINEIKSELDVINTEKADLEVTKGELEEEKSNLEAKQEELNTLLEENKETLATLQAESEATLELMALTDEELSKLSAELQEYYKQQQQQQQQQKPDGGGSTPQPTPSVPSTGGYVWPTPGFHWLSSQFEEWRGYYNHGAIDIAGGGIMGANCYAAAAGTVVSVNTSCAHNWGKYYSCGCGGGYGNYVWINHGNGKETVYAHLTSVAVSSGQYVTAGQYIGTVGTTGHSTGPHLHFETRYNGVKYDPMSEY